MAYHDLFSIDPDAHYLNCAYMAPVSKRVADAGRAALARLASPHDLGVADFFEPPNRVRQLFAELIGTSDPSRVAIVPSVSYGMATVVRNTRLAAGQRVVLVAEQFPSAVYSWRRACAEAGAELVVVSAPADAAARAEAWNESLLAAVTTATAAVVVPELHWTDGVRFDLQAIGRQARGVGARLVVDGTQSVGAHPFDVGRSGADAVICAGYKWLTGPYGVGLAYFGDVFDDGVPLEENWITREGSDDFAGLVRYRDTYRPGAERYDVGERSSFIMMPLLETALAQVREWGPQRVAAHTAALTNPIVPALEALGCRVEGPAWRAGHLLGIHLPRGADPRRIAEELASRQVSVSLRGSAIRVSPHLYNDAGDMEALVGALTSTLG